VSRYRVTTSAKSFDLERFAGTDKEGKEVWHKEAFCRSRADLLASIKSRGLSADLAADVPSYHDDAYRALASVGQSGGERSEAQQAALEKAHAARRAKRAAS
jgi:hypothetical protein